MNIHEYQGKAVLKEIGAPAIIGAKGIEKVMNIRLKNNEREMFMKSVAALEKIIAECQEMEPDLLGLDLFKFKKTGR